MSKVRRQKSEVLLDKPKLKLIKGGKSSQTLEAKPENRLLKLIELASKRKDVEVKVPAKRGRKPKVDSLDFNPDNRDEDSYVYEQEEVVLEYEGIEVKKESPEVGFNVEAVDKIEEELNFDA
jgi:hypothetical protein